MTVMTIRYLDVDMVEVELDGHKRTVTREIAEVGLHNARIMQSDPVVGEAAKEQVKYFERCLGYMDATADSDDDLFCSEHQREKNLVDYEDGSRYECPECQRERGEELGLI
jgi:hypothetical protein